MNILDIYAGTGSATRAFALAGHSVVLVEIDASRIDSDLKALPNVHIIEMDVRIFAQNPFQYLPVGWIPDFIWLSPPCQCFSLGGGGAGWRRWARFSPPHPCFGPRCPVTPESILACNLVIAGLLVVKWFPNAYWLVENPRAGLRTMLFMEPYQRWEITHCQYGDSRMKATDLWGRMPAAFNPKPPCKARMNCHTPAPRGSKTVGSTQGLTDEKDRGRLPNAFSAYLLEIMAGHKA